MVTSTFEDTNSNNINNSTASNNFRHTYYQDPVASSQQLHFTFGELWSVS